MTMKAVLLFLLAAGWALHTGTALECYFCRGNTNGANCRSIQNCTREETQCQTERINAVGLLTIFNKGCSVNCKEEFKDYLVGKKNVTCCSTNLCNVSGTQALSSVSVILALITTLGGLLVWGSGQL
ncbi:prostate stem cell antigen [Erinaceus europaeus]|uniref:Prostate stem cell antigen n=1 Tax=Erinaceus europaeus TaxID=9365 RepID=A0A1S3AI33_ERIEU|nr:prostate stem cell antigen [Erinaceus europaeus]